MALMKHTEIIHDTRKFIMAGLHIKMHKSLPEGERAAAFAFNKAVSLISNDSIQFLMDNKNARLRIQKLKPKPDHPNGRRNKR